MDMEECLVRVANYIYFSGIVNDTDRSDNFS